jgi:hypothetical protein
MIRWTFVPEGMGLRNASLDGSGDPLRILCDPTTAFLSNTVCTVILIEFTRPPTHTGAVNDWWQILILRNRDKWPPEITHFRTPLRPQEVHYTNSSCLTMPSGA